MAWFDCGYCSGVIVRDMQGNEVWTFLVNCWLSVMHKGSSTDCIVLYTAP